MHSRPLLPIAALLLITVLIGCGEDEVTGTLISVRNERLAPMMDLSLLLSGDTLRMDSLGGGCSAEWAGVRMDSSSSIVLQWTLSGEYHRFEPLLIDTAFMASLIEFSIPSGDVDLNIAYHFR